MTDSAAEQVSTVRIPRDEFEVELFRRFIQSATERWYGNDEKIKIKVDEYLGDGFYSLYVWEENDDLMKIFEPKGQMRGKVWLAENEYPASEYYRVQVWHHVEGQTANYGVGPYLPWILEDELNKANS